jgi:hypothetical protein
MTQCVEITGEHPTEVGFHKRSRIIGIDHPTEVTTPTSNRIKDIMICRYHPSDERSYEDIYNDIDDIPATLHTPTYAFHLSKALAIICEMMAKGMMATPADLNRMLKETWGDELDLITLIIIKFKINGRGYEYWLKLTPSKIIQEHLSLLSCKKGRTTGNIFMRNEICGIGIDPFDMDGQPDETLWSVPRPLSDTQLFLSRAYLSGNRAVADAGEFFGVDSAWSGR